MNGQNKLSGDKLKQKATNFDYVAINAISGSIVVVSLALFIWRNLVSNESHGEDIGILFWALILYPIAFIGSIINVVIYFKKIRKEKISASGIHYLEKMVYIFFLCVSIAVLAYPLLIMFRFKFS